MSPVEPSKVISSARITFYLKGYFGAKSNFVYTTYNENHKLLEILFDLYEVLEVDGYDEGPTGLYWSIKNNWYTSDQIERMLALKAFT
jgi:hypothetical protein